MIPVNTSILQLTQVTVVSADVADLQRGRHLSHAGANLAVFDLFDSGKPLNIMYDNINYWCLRMLNY